MWLLVLLYKGEASRDTLFLRTRAHPVCGKGFSRLNELHDNTTQPSDADVQTRHQMEAVECPINPLPISSF